MRCSLPFLCWGEGEAAGTAPGQAAPRAALIWWCRPRFGAAIPGRAASMSIFQTHPAEPASHSPAPVRKGSSFLHSQQEPKHPFSFKMNAGNAFCLHANSPTSVLPCVYSLAVLTFPSASPFACLFSTCFPFVDAAV